MGDIIWKTNQFKTRCFELLKRRANVQPLTIILPLGFTEGYLQIFTLSFPSLCDEFPLHTDCLWFALKRYLSLFFINCVYCRWWWFIEKARWLRCEARYPSDEQYVLWRSTKNCVLPVQAFKGRFIVMVCWISIFMISWETSMNFQCSKENWNSPSAERKRFV